MSHKPLEYAVPPPRRPRGWQFLVIVAMLALGVLLLGFARIVIRTKTAVPKPTTAPAYSTRGW